MWRRDKTARPKPPERPTRRGLLTGAFLKPALVAPPPAPAAAPPPAPSPPARAPLRIRPPGARPEAEFLARCDGCARCVSACPHEVILMPQARHARHDQTPMLMPDRRPCHLCEDRPCIAACPTDALSFDLPIQLGKAHLNTFDCLAHQRVGCSTCFERCPVDGAITLERGRPRFHASACVGCGLCASICPAPARPILIIPGG